MEKQLTVKEEQKFLADLQGEFSGVAKVRKELLKTPRLKLANALSESVKSGLAKSGEFACDVKEANFGTSVTIIPVVFNESASLLDKESSSILCSTKDMISNQDGAKCSQCPFGEYWNDWGTKEKVKIPGCKTSIDMLVVVYDRVKKIIHEEIMEMNFRKNNYKAGLQLLRKLMNTKLYFSKSYTLNSKSDSKGKYTFHIIDPSKIEDQNLTVEEIRKVAPLVRHYIHLQKSGEINMNLHDEEEPASDIPI